jgi:mannan endo-1,4-beta-mannosidase
MHGSDLSHFAAFNGFHGVDNADILNIPDIDFSTFQIFLEQNVYGPSHPDLSPFQNSIQVGIDWIRVQAALGTA